MGNQNTTDQDPEQINSTTKATLIKGILDLLFAHLFVIVVRGNVELISESTARLRICAPQCHAENGFSISAKHGCSNSHQTFSSLL